MFSIPKIAKNEVLSSARADEVRRCTCRVLDAHDQRCYVNHEPSGYQTKLVVQDVARNKTLIIIFGVTDTGLNKV